MRLNTAGRPDRNWWPNSRDRRKYSPGRNARNLTQEKLAELADLNIRTARKSKRVSYVYHNGDPPSTALNCPWTIYFPLDRRVTLEYRLIFGGTNLRKGFSMA